MIIIMINIILWKCLTENNDNNINLYERSTNTNKIKYNNSEKNEQLFEYINLIKDKEEFCKTNYGNYNFKNKILRQNYSFIWFEQFK
jgi:hypothetical protein